MSFTFQCPYCKHELEASEAWIGQKASCPSCNKEVLIQNTGNTKSYARLKPAPQNYSPHQTATTHNEEHSQDTSYTSEAITIEDIVNKTAAFASNLSKPPEDSSEDNFVLIGITVLKVLFRILVFIVSTISIFLIIYWFCDHESEKARALIWYLIGYICSYLICNLVLSWFRGIYRNLLCIKTIIRNQFDSHSSSTKH